MGNVSKFVPEQSKTVAAIFAYHKKRSDSEPVRGYLGASIIGHSCDRYLWYLFRQCCKPSFDGRMYRLFETGDLEEHRFVTELRAIGCTVYECNEDGEQWEVTAHGGHFSGHMDGCAIGIPEAQKSWHVLEFKTHNAKSFAKLEKEGVKKSKPQHYAQMMAYMHLTGMKRALYLARNKDSDNLYSERIRYDKAEAQALMDRAERIIFSTVPPARIANRPDWYECGWCDAKPICWGDAESAALPLASISCRQCCHATPTLDGHAHWFCEKHKRGLSVPDQGRACKHHLVLPGLISFAEATDHGDDGTGHGYIEFTEPDGFKWRHSCTDGTFSTAELMTLPAEKLRNSMVATAKETLGATVDGYCADDILSRYPEEDSRCAWKGPSESFADAWRTVYQEDVASLAQANRCDTGEFIVAEYADADNQPGRIAIFRKSNGQVEIREGKE